MDEMFPRIAPISSAEKIVSAAPLRSYVGSRNSSSLCPERRYLWISDRRAPHAVALPNKITNLEFTCSSNFHPPLSSLHVTNLWKQATPDPTTWCPAGTNSSATPTIQQAASAAPAPPAAVSTGFRSVSEDSNDFTLYASKYAQEFRKGDQEAHGTLPTHFVP